MRASIGFKPFQGKQKPEVKPFEAMLRRGDAIEVPSRHDFPGARVAIDALTYEQLVAWPHRAMRNHMIALCESARMTSLLKAAAGVFRHDTPAEFVVRAVASDASSSKEVRHALILRRMNEDGRPCWLICQ